MLEITMGMTIKGNRPNQNKPNANNSSGNNNDGTAVGAPTYAGDQWGGQAINLICSKSS